MSDPTIHDSLNDGHWPDDIFQSRILTAMRRLDGPESNADIAAALDSVDLVPLDETTIQRIMAQTRIRIASDDAAQLASSTLSAIPAPSVLNRRASPSGFHFGQVSIVVTCLGLLLAAGIGFTRLGEAIRIGGPIQLGSRHHGNDHLGAHGLIGAAQVDETRQVDSIATAGKRDRAKPGELLTTGPREKRRVTLPDGSTLSINELSKVEILSRRRIKLLQGEVFVEVVPRLQAGLRPEPEDRFVVETPQREVTALGTKFVVKAQGRATNVVVTQGKVAVSGFGPVIPAGRELVADLTELGSAELRPARRSAYVVEWVKDLMAAGSMVIPSSEHSGGTITVLDPQGQEMKLSLRKFHVDVHIEDGFARTTIDQTYFNHTWQQLEGTFRFPLPADASLSRLAMYVNGTLMEGGMVERNHGRNVFEQIRHTRRDPALLEWLDGSTFQMRVFPLEPRQEKRIILSYTQRLARDYGKSVYRFPAGHNLEGVQEWSTNVRVKRGSGTKWYSPSHLLTARDDHGDLVIEGREEYAALDRDLVIEIGGDVPVTEKSPPVWSHYDQDGFRYVMLRYRPELSVIPVAKPQRRNWIFLVENSADRNAILAETQRQIAKVLLENCEHSDTFSLIRAGTQSDLFAPKAVECSLDNVAAAIKFLNEVAPIGALDLGQALQSVQQQVAEGRDNWIVHLGTGIPVLGERDETTLLRLLPRHARYVGVAVGKRWSKSFMETAARRTGGHLAQINPDEAVAWRAFDLLSTLNAPRLTDIAVTSARSGEPDTAENSPQYHLLATSLAHGQELAAVARFPLAEPLPTEVIVTGKLAGQSYSQPLLLDPIPEGELAGMAMSAHLPRTWAKLEIDRLVALGAEENKGPIIALSKQMYVMSPFTSLLVLETEAMYAQFNVDRGRKDHWALYPAPAQIPVVADNGPVQLSPLADAKERLSQAKKRVEAAQSSYDRSVAEKRPVSDLQRFQRRISAEQAELTRIDSEIRRIELADAASSDPVRMAWNSVIARRSLWQVYARHFPNHWGYRGGRWLRRYSGRTPEIDLSFQANTDWFNSFSQFDTYDAIVSTGSRPPTNWNDSYIPLWRNDELVTAGDPVRGTVAVWNAQNLTILSSELSTQRHGFGAIEGRWGIGQPTLEGLFGSVPRNDDGVAVTIKGLGLRPIRTIILSDGLSDDLFRASVDRSPQTFFVSGINAPLEFAEEWGRGIQITDGRMYAGGYFQADGWLEPTLQTTELGNVTSAFGNFTGSGVLGDHQFDWNETQSFVLPRGGVVYYSDGIYAHPLAGLIQELPGYAPGLQTWMADRLAAIEPVLPTKPVLGAVDVEARRLIDQARSLGWQRIEFTGNRLGAGRSTQVTADGTGRFFMTREVSAGLKETVIQDGTDLWHLYPEIGLGARRPVTRFHQPAIQALLAWYVPPANDLSAGADLKFVGARTVRIIPHRQEKLAAKPGGIPSTDGKVVDRRIVVELVFAESGGLAESRVLDADSNRVLRKLTIASDGTMRLFHDNQLVSEGRVVRESVDAPSLIPDTAGLVVLPLPYRSAGGVPVKVPVNLQSNSPDFASLSDEDALKLLATYFAEARSSELATFIEQRYTARGDHRIGLAVLMSSIAPNNALVATATKQHPDSPLAVFLEQFSGVVTNASLDATLTAGERGGPFLHRVCGEYNHLTRWRSDLAASRERLTADVDKELDATLQFARESRSLEFMALLLSAVQSSLQRTERWNAVTARKLVDATTAIAEQWDVPEFGRSERINWLMLIGDDPAVALATELLKREFAQAIDTGNRPNLRTDTREAFVKHFKTPVSQPCEPWGALVMEAARSLRAKERRLELLEIARRCVGLAEPALASSICDMAIEDQDLSKNSALNLVSLQYAKEANDWKLAELCIQRTLADDELRKDSRYWRDAAEIAHHRARFAEWIESLDKAYQMEFASLPKSINVEAFRQDYGKLFEQLEQRTEQLTDAGTAEKMAFAAIVQKSAARWREIDVDETQVCHRTARMLTKLGLATAAWNYWTTPLAKTPDQSAVWQTFANAMNEEQRFVEADRAWATAFACEPTNPEILYQHAVFLRSLRQEQRAVDLFHRVATGAWQPRFDDVKHRAQFQARGEPIPK